MATYEQFMAWVNSHPGQFVATVGLVLSSSYLILVLVTKLGEIKTGVQTFVLSGLIHVVMAGFWGTLAVPGHSNSTGRAPLQPTLIREVIVEGPAGATGPGGTETGTGDAPWEQLSGLKQDPFARAEAQTGGGVPLDAPNRTREVMEAAKGALPDLPEPVEVAAATPVPAAAESQQRSAAESAVDIGEDTAESRPEVSVPGGPSRGALSPVISAGPEVERSSVPEQMERTNVAVQAPGPAGVADDLLDDTGPVRKPTESAMAARRNGPARSVVDIDDLGSPTDAPAGSPSGVPNGKSLGTPTGTGTDGGTGAGKFSRVGPTVGTSSGPAIGGMIERTSPSASGGGVAGGTGTGGPTIAALNPGGIRTGLSGREKPGLGGISSGAIPARGSAIAPNTYGLRNLPQRQKMAVRLGATEDSERAVETSLRWLALHQNIEGFWDADGFDANCPTRDRCWGKGGQGNLSETEKINNPVDRVALQSAGQNADTGLTALILLTYLGAGYTQEEGQYSDQVDRAVRWLIRQQQPNGYLGGQASHYERMYCHGMATYALGEACGMLDDSNSDPQLRQALAKAVRYIVSMQNPNDGGWRYLDGKLARQEGDMSMFGWQLMALKSSQIAGIEVPEDTQAGMIKFLKRISVGERRGLASYRYGEAPKASMTAEALFSRQMLGMKRDNPASLEAIEYLMKHPPHQTEQDLYYWYYGTLAMYQYGGEPWRRWNDQLRDTLVATQRKTGHAAGSWDPRDNWSQHGGRLYSTALSTLCLEVYYRFLPLYQLNGSGADGLEN